jgi:hypothetical protein
MNPITTKDETEVTLCLSDEECRNQRLAPNGELHRDDAFSSHWLVSPTPLTVMLVLINLSSEPPGFLNKEYNIKLTIAPPSTNMHEIDFPLMRPFMYKAFR